MNNLGLRSLFCNTSTTFVRQLITMIFHLGLVVLLARILGPQGNGMYATAILLPTLISTFANLGIAPANVFFIARGEVSIRLALKATVLLWSILCIVSFALVAPVIWLRGEMLFPDIPHIFLWIALFIFPFILLHSLFVSLLQGIQDFRRFNYATLVPPGITLVFAVIGVGLFDLGVVGALIAFALGYIVGTFVTIRFLKRYVDSEDRASKHVVQYIKECIGYGWKAHLSNIFAFVNYRTDIYLVNFFLAPASTGIYVIAVQIAERLWMLSRSVGTVVLPRLSELHNDEDKRKFLTPLVSRFVLFVTLVGSTTIALIADPVINLVFGKEYADASIALLWLLPGIVLGSFSRVLANDLAARGRPDLNMYTALLVILVNIIANIILIPRMGINGAAIATTVAYSINALAKLFLYARLSKNSWWQPILFNKKDWELVCRGYKILLKG